MFAYVHATRPMKKRITLLSIFFLIMSSGFVVTASDAIDTVIEPPKNKNLFTFKTGKELVGGQVEIYNSKGELITSQSLQKRKMVIDFDDAHFGAYTIKIVKGKAEREFRYIKK